MKHKYITLLLLVLSMYATSVNAFYFWVDGFKYRTVDKNEPIVELVSVPLRYEGTCAVPSSVKYQGKSYRVVSVAPSAFCDCVMLSEVRIGSGVHTVDFSAFNGCCSLMSVACASECPPAVASKVFEDGVFADVTLAVPRGCKAAYEQAPVWRGFATIIEK